VCISNVGNKNYLLIIEIAIPLTFTTHTTVFADEHRADYHDDKKHHDGYPKYKKLFSELADHDDDKDYHDEERHNA
jgi:hypothetical protein